MGKKLDFNFALSRDQNLLVKSHQNVLIKLKIIFSIKKLMCFVVLED